MTRPVSDSSVPIGKIKYSSKTHIVLSVTHQTTSYRRSIKEPSVEQIASVAAALNRGTSLTAHQLAEWDAGGDEDSC